MSADYEGRVALVTGGTSGIGASTVRAFARAGARVVFVARREAPGQAMVRELGGAADFLPADLADPETPERIVQHILDRYGRLDFAFNNAGVFDRSDTFGAYTDEAWRNSMNLNLDAVFRCMRTEIAAGCRVIVNNASTVAVRASERASPAYVAAKHAVLGLTRYAALEYAQAGIRVNAVGPGPTNTAIAAPLATLSDAERAEHLQPVNPNAQLVDPDDVAQAVLFLCSDQASMINGHLLPLDGGQLARL